VHGWFFDFLGVNGGVVHDRFRGHQWWCSAWSWVRIFVLLGSNIFDILGVNSGIVHGREFESLTFRGVNGGVVYGPGFESLTFWGQWWCSAWTWVRIFNLKCSIIHSILHGSIQQLHCIQPHQNSISYGSPISRWFISSMDPFMDMRGY
jgi:hypothetical protein